jgi:hypothetical protein
MAGAVGEFDPHATKVKTAVRIEALFIRNALLFA